MSAVALLQQQGNHFPVSAGETAASGIAAREKAQVLARFEWAIRYPRNMDSVRQELLRECRRPSFANNKSTLYRKPIGEGIEGLGIRFVEVALRCMKNVIVDSQLIYEDEAKETHRVTVQDIEANVPYSLEVVVTKTVERSRPEGDGSYVSARTNSYGKPVYTVRATDDDLLNKRASLISKAIRTLGLRIIPGDLQDEAEDIIKTIRKDEAAKDPDAERKRLVDAFDGLNVRVEQLVEYLGHGLETTTPAELVELRGLYGALKDGEATWATVIDNLEERRAAAAKSAAEAAAKAKTKKADKGADGARQQTADVAKPETEKAKEPDREMEAAAERTTPATRKPSSGPTYAEIMSQINVATSPGELNAARDLIRSVHDGEQKGELIQALNAALDKFTTGSDSLE